MLMPVIASKRHIRMMLVVLIGLLSGVICPARVAADESKLRVAIVGDSTVASYPNPPADRPELTGWGKIHTILRPYAEAKLAVGAKQIVAVIDLHQASVELFNGVGDEGSGDFSPNSSDRTHFSRKRSFGNSADGVSRRQAC